MGFCLSYGLLLATVLTADETAGWQTLVTKGEPTARHEASFVGFGDKMYLLGGRRVNPVDVFDPRTEERTQNAKCPIKLHHFQGVVFWK